MSDHFIIKHLRRFHATQLMILFFLLFFFFTVYEKTPKDNLFSPRPLNYKSRFENFYNQDLPHVEVDVPLLYYSGLDHAVNGRLKGHYYYTLTDGYCQFYILPGEPDAAPAPVLASLNLRGRLIRLNDIKYRSILNNMEEHLSWTAASLKKRTSPYAVSAIPDPFYMTVIFYVVLFGGVVLLLADILCTGFYLCTPLYSPAFRYLGPMKERRKRYARLETEFRYSLSAKSRYLYLTTEYLVVFKPLHCVIIPLKFIAQTYCHSRRKGVFEKSSHFVRQLTVITLDGHSCTVAEAENEDFTQLLMQLQKNLSTVSGYREAAAKHVMGKDGV